MWDTRKWKWIYYDWKQISDCLSVDKACGEELEGSIINRHEIIWGCEWYLHYLDGGDGFPACTHMSKLTTLCALNTVYCMPIIPQTVKMINKYKNLYKKFWNLWFPCSFYSWGLRLYDGLISSFRWGLKLFSYHCDVNQHIQY